MIKIFIVLVLFCGRAWAGEVFHLNPSNRLALTKMHEFLNAKPGPRQGELFRELQGLNPGGLAYIENVLKTLAADQYPWQTYSDSQLLLLNTLPDIIERLQNVDGFHGSMQWDSIHQSARKLLKRARRQVSSFRTNILAIYDKLQLWDQSDLPLLISQYFNDRAYAGVLFRVLQQSSPDSYRQFARRVRGASGRVEMVDLLLMYQSGLIRKKELIWLFHTLMENTFWQSVGPSFDFIYGPSSKAVDELKKQVILNLRAKLIAKDRMVVDAYNAVVAHPAWQGQTLSSPQLKQFREFLQQLKSEDTALSCEPALLK